MPKQDPPSAPLMPERVPHLLSTFWYDELSASTDDSDAENVSPQRRTDVVEFQIWNTMPSEQCGFPVLLAAASGQSEPAALEHLHL
eukprot:CAMPEP_0169138400 /NCGR_PEP_ID=MMETSP1015-20121227/42220_1 /TAXON_ID=342587 /ORGANISM="Karlodinium micrum, Strain CCMP2283" /LENGTH=85 /DNA_ID=CAMNT_0009203645 /DNA_START=100 /DNA_END=357 /DNA_ORIENTATION=+